MQHLETLVPGCEVRVFPGEEPQGGVLGMTAHPSLCLLPCLPVPPSSGLAVRASALCSSEGGPPPVGLQGLPWNWS